MQIRKMRSSGKLYPLYNAVMHQSIIDNQILRSEESADNINICGMTAYKNNGIISLIYFRQLLFQIPLKWSFTGYKTAGANRCTMFFYSFYSGIIHLSGTIHSQVIVTGIIDILPAVNMSNRTGNKIMLFKKRITDIKCAGKTLHGSQF